MLSDDERVGSFEEGEEGMIMVRELRAGQYLDHQQRSF